MSDSWFVQCLNVVRVWKAAEIKFINEKIVSYL
jgi:hypothetical protein